ncbi:hypothetical protein KI387_018769, partial [Taxus chinensis]
MPLHLEAAAAHWHRDGIGLQLPAFAFAFAFSRNEVMVSATLSRRRRNYSANKSNSTTVVYAQSHPEWWKREEERWLREEQRWLREEARWLREEARWHAQHRALQAQISSLTQQLQQLSPSPAPAPAPPQLTVTGVDLQEQIFTSNQNQSKNKKRTTLTRGSRGEDVKEMQEALQRLGFYSGEEDMEYSSFDGGTQKAVKSWQATLGIAQDGAMTVELLAKLLGEEMLDTHLEEELINGASVPLSEKEGLNGSVPIQAVTEIAQIQQAISIKPEGVEISEKQVYLLGENRWEEPQRLLNKQKSGSKVDTIARCINCRGEGKIFCSECEGTGDLNVEEQ